MAGLKDEITQLKEGYAQLAGDLQALVRKLTDLFPQLTTRDQVDSLTDGIAVMLNRFKGR